MQYELGFIGAGNMAEAIARAAINSGIVEAGKIIASDIAEARRDVFAGLGMVVTESNDQVISQSKQVLLATKPQQVEQVAQDLAKYASDEQVIISIMAGISSAKLGGLIVAARDGKEDGAPRRIVRVMPNTPLMAGVGMAGVALGEHARDDDAQLALKLFGAAGEAIEVDESAIDAITAVSGSGPAYVFYLAEAMEKAAADLGLGEHARLLVTQTILGAANLMKQTGEDPAELRRKVTSPGGTTEAAVKHLDGNKSLDVFANAVKAAEARSRELGA